MSPAAAGDAAHQVMAAISTGLHRDGHPAEEAERFAVRFGRAMLVRLR